MASDVDIVNMALAKLGHGAIASLLDDSDSARAANAVYAICRDDVEAAHPWNFNTKWIKLAQVTGTPANPDFKLAYALPGEVLQVWSLGENVAKWAWVVEGKQLLTDVDLPVAQCTVRITDSALFSAPVTTAIAYRLTAELCNSLTARRGNAQDYWQLYRDKLQEAKTSDGQEGSDFRDDDSPLADVRRLGGSGVSVNKMP